jgi:hypothetical protein
MNIVFEKFKEFRIFYEKQCGRSIKFPRLENGGEYVDRPFEEYLIRFGIEWKWLVLHTPQQNGDTKHKNWMLVRMARCILQDKYLPPCFLYEVIYCATISSITSLLELLLP